MIGQLALALAFEFLHDRPDCYMVIKRRFNNERDDADGRWIEIRRSCIEENAQ